MILMSETDNLFVRVEYAEIQQDTRYLHEHLRIS
jgi:hypothetical protein